MLPAVCRAESAAGVTLEECYRLALAQSELIAIDAERIKEAEAHFLQALGTILPQVSFSRTQDRERSESSPLLNRSMEQKFVFKQTLFSGFKEFAAMSGSNYEKSQRAKEKLRAQQLLWVDVADAFYLVLEEREDLAALETIRTALNERIDDLNTRVKIGKSRTSEVVSTQTQLYTLEAEIELVKSQERVARDLLEFLIGRPADALADSQEPIVLQEEPAYAARASSRLDVQAADLAQKLDEKQVTVAKSGFLPTVSLEGDYFSHRSSAPQDSRWATLLTIDVPIFEGTTTWGRVKEARALARESALAFQRTGRVALQDIHDAYTNMAAALARKDALEKALQSAELNYKLQSEDYKMNIVNNLDVLTAIQELEDARRAFNHVAYEGKRFYWQLRAAAGDIPVA